MRKDPLNLDDSTSAAQSAKVSETFTLGAQQAIANAQDLARSVGSERVESAHLLLGALQLKPPNPQLSALFQLGGLNPEEVRLYAQSAIETNEPLASEATFKLDESLRRTMRQAGREARHSACAQVDVAHIVIACFRAQPESNLAAVLAPLEVSADQLSRHLRGLKRGATAAEVYDENPLAHLSRHGERALEAAHSAMRAHFCGRISTLHLLIGILENPDSEAVAALQTLMINVDELKQRSAVAAIGDGEVAGPNQRFTPAAKRALDRAKAAARDGGRSHIGSADLLIGLLPQPLLLIERAQFGARPDDPAAALLRDVDADLVRAIFDPEQAATPPVKPIAVAPITAPDNVRDLRFAMFFTLFCIQASLCSLSSIAKFGRGMDTNLVMAFVAIMVGCGLITCAMLIFSKSPMRKANWQWGFVGAMAGILVVATLSGVFR